MKTEHEKLKEICDKVGIDINKIDNDIWWEGCNNEYRIPDDANWDARWSNKVDVRTIIFTQEFMDKYNKWFNDNCLWLWDEVINILNHLDNPVNYLYSLTEEENA